MNTWRTYFDGRTECDAERLIMALKEEISRLHREKTALEEENKVLCAEIDDLCEEVSDLQDKIDNLEEAFSILYDECVTNAKSEEVNYVAVSLDLNYCIPLYSDDALSAANELLSKCLVKGFSAKGFKVFEKAELL